MTIDPVDISNKLTIHVNDKSYYTNSNLSYSANPAQIYDFAYAINGIQLQPLNKIIRTVESRLECWD